jgi:hypothetical protein
VTTSASSRRGSLAVAILLTGTSAAATPVDIDRCVDVKRQEVMSLVDLEFASFADPQALRVTVGCDKRGVTLAVEDRRTGRRRSRSLDVEHTARPARARLLALAAAEVAAALLAEVPAPAPSPSPVPAAPDARPSPTAVSTAAPSAAPSPAPSPAVVATPPPGSAPVPPALVSPPLPSPSPAAWERDHRPRLRLLAEVGGSRFFSLLATTTEVGLTVRHEGWRLLEAALGLSGTRGRVTSKGRQASADSFCITPLVGLHRRLGPTTARVATGPRLALGRLQAVASVPGDQATTFTAPWLAWLAEVGLATPVGPRFVVELMVRGGYVLSPIGGRIAGDRAIAVQGPWIGAALSVGALL